MNYFILLIGVVIGVLLTLLFFYRKSGYGYFIIESYDDDETGFYKINIRIPTQDKLLKKKQIILYKEDSQK